jgi:PhnB protein
MIDGRGQRAEGRRKHREGRPSAIYHLPSVPSVFHFLKIKSLLIFTMLALQNEFPLRQIKKMITAYLTFNGKTEEAFNFYKSVLGGEFTSFQRFGDTPQGGAMSEEDKKKIMHLSWKSGTGDLLMGNDHLDFMGGPFNAGNNFSLSLHPDSEAAADKLYKKLSEEGTVIMPMAKVFWGAYFGMFIDKFGIKWMINYQ